MLRPRTFPPRTFLYSVWRNLTKKSLLSRDTWAWKASRWFILLSGAFDFCFHPFVLCRLQKACPASLGSASSCPRPEIQMKAPLINGGCLPVFGPSLPSYGKWCLLGQGISPPAGRALFNPCTSIGTAPIIVLRRGEFRCFAFDYNDWVCLGRSFQKKLACWSMAQGEKIYLQCGWSSSTQQEVQKEEEYRRLNWLFLTDWDAIALIWDISIFP